MRAAKDADTVSTDPIVILGAGPAGISAAWRLSELGHTVVVLERDGAVGGMGKTIKVGDLRGRLRPAHLSHPRDRGEPRDPPRDPAVLRTGSADPDARHARAAPRQGIRLSARDAAGAARASARCSPRGSSSTTSSPPSKSTFAPPKHEDSFEEWGVRNLGRTLYDLCFGIYSERVWGLPTSQISSKQAQRVAKLNLKNIILRTLGIKADPATYFTKYMYPRAGHQRPVREHGRGVHGRAGRRSGCESPVVRLERDGDRIARVVYLEQGVEKTIACAASLSTLPLPALVDMMTPALPARGRASTPRSCAIAASS